MRVDPNYFRPAEVETLLGDSSLLESTVGWQPSFTVEELCEDMVLADLKEAVREAALLDQGL